MEAFTLDTSGFVAVTFGNGPTITVAKSWSDLDPFTQGYIEALFGSEVMYGPQRWQAPLREFVGFSDLAPETLAAILKDCGVWRDVVRSLHMASWALRKEDGASLWAVRNGGDGFMDQGFAHAEVLRGAFKARRFPPLTAYLGDDGRVYLRSSSEGTLAPPSSERDISRDTANLPNPNPPTPHSEEEA